MASLSRRQTKNNQSGRTYFTENNGKDLGPAPKTDIGGFRQLFGFELRDFTSWRSFVRLLCRPTDPAALGALRFFYGFLLFIDTLEERGMGQQAYRRWSPDRCYAPVFDFIKPLSVAWMYLLYFIMLLATISIMFGFLYRWSLMIFTGVYWYIILLDGTVWNNHSYLFGLLAFLLLLTDGNRYMSIDGLIWPEIRNQAVPLWNYTVMRFQVFIVYFFAGIKKLDPEWMYGWSQMHVSGSWVFDIFRPFLTDDQIDLYVVHWIGCVLDMTLGYVLFFDKTRVFGLIFGFTFHAMNSQIYSIGMFPFIGMATMTVFCYPNWPRKFFRKILPWSQPSTFRSSRHCLYSKGDTKPESRSKQMQEEQNVAPKDCPTKPGRYHILSTFFVIVYIAEQVFLPFSFGVFKGLDNDIGGVYGYSWNMMIYSPDPYIKIYIKDLDTGEKTDISKLVSHKSERNRWSYNPYMLLQYTQCLARKVDVDGTLAGSFAITYDIWIKVNRRFRRRLYDPDKDMLTAKWSLFSKTDWVLPPLENYWEMRNKKSEMIHKRNDTVFRFQADLPGYTNTIKLDNTNDFTIEVMKGKINLEDPILSQNTTLQEGESLLLPARDKLLVHTISDEPSYMSISKPKDTKFERYMKAVEAKENGEDPDGKLMKEFDKEDIYGFDLMIDEMKKQKERPYGPDWCWEGFVSFIKTRLFLFKHGLFYAFAAVRSILGGKAFEEYAKSSKTYFG